MFDVPVLPLTSILLAVLAFLLLPILVYYGAQLYGRALLNRLRRKDEYFNKLYDFVTNHLNCPVKSSVFLSSGFYRFKIPGLFFGYGIVLGRGYLVNKNGAETAVLAHEAGHFIHYANSVNGRFEFTMNCPFGNQKNGSVECYLDKEISAWIYAFEILEKVFEGKFDKREFANCAASALFSYFIGDEHFDFRGDCPLRNEIMMELATLENLITANVAEVVITEKMAVLKREFGDIIKEHKERKSIPALIAPNFWLKIKTNRLINYNPPFHIFKPR